MKEPTTPVLEINIINIYDIQQLFSVTSDFHWIFKYLYIYIYLSMYL